MGVLSNAISREQLKPGDHIYSWRQVYIYAHHGIYIGNGKVAHFTQSGGDKKDEIGTSSNQFPVSCSSAHFPDYPCLECGDQSREDGVIRSCLDCFLAGGDLYRFEYGVSVTFFLAKIRSGTCTFASSDSSEVVLARTSFLLENGFGEYDMFKNNCEDFAVYCKTGLISLGTSGQARSVLSVMKSILSSPVGYFFPKWSTPALVGNGLYNCISRYCGDVGVRRDVEKIDVEELKSRFSSARQQREPRGVVTVVQAYKVLHSR